MLNFVLYVFAFLGVMIVGSAIVELLFIIVDKIIAARRRKIARQTRIEMYKQMSQEYQRTGRRTW